MLPSLALATALTLGAADAEPSAHPQVERIMQKYEVTRATRLEALDRARAERDARVRALAMGRLLAQTSHALRVPLVPKPVAPPPLVASILPPAELQSPELCASTPTAAPARAGGGAGQAASDAER